MMKTQQKIRTAMVLLMIAIATTGFSQSTGKVEYAKVINDGSVIAIPGVQYAASQQSSIKLEKNTNLSFRGESKKSEIKIKITDEYNIFKVRLLCQSTSGVMVVELIDPKGDKRGTFTVKSNDDIVTGDNTTVMEEVAGEMEKYFQEPIKGDWIIRAIPSNATSTLRVNTTLFFEPKIEYVGISRVSGKESEK